jgi:NAD-dependent deacetylase
MSAFDELDLRRAASILGRARRIAVLTGAGISAESGVPTFRGAGGLWKGRRSIDMATQGAFDSDPRAVWEFYMWRIRALADVAPNPGHEALVDLEARAEKFWLITQNVDGLHRAAGSRNVIELHGTLATARCRRCSFSRPTKELSDDPLPTCPDCGDLLRPAVVWFGEQLPEAAMAGADEAIRECDVMLVAGTSGVVEPAASFARWAAARGAAVVEVNLASTPLTAFADVSVFGAAGEMLPRIVG